MLSLKKLLYYIIKLYPFKFNIFTFRNDAIVLRKSKFLPAKCDDTILSVTEHCIELTCRASNL